MVSFNLPLLFSVCEKHLTLHERLASGHASRSEHERHELQWTPLHERPASVRASRSEHERNYSEQS